jgi:hypothetical protein
MTAIGRHLPLAIGHSFKCPGFEAPASPCSSERKEHEFKRRKEEA